MTDHDILIAEIASDPNRTLATLADALGWTAARVATVNDTLRRRGLLRCSGRHGVRLLTQRGQARAMFLQTPASLVLLDADGREVQP